MHSLSLRPDSAITDRLYEIRKGERAFFVEFLDNLNEMDRRRIHLRFGFSSVFVYCTEHLKMPKATTWRRTTCAKLMARFPIVREYLVDGRLCERTLPLLRGVLEESRLGEILDRAAGRTEDQIEELVVALAPKPVPADLFQKLPTPSSSRREPVEQSPEVARQASLPLAVPVKPPARIEPVAPELHVMRVTVGSDFKADLEAVRDELSHKFPGASLETILHECIRVTLDTCRKRRRGAGKKKTWKLPPAGSRDYPSAVKHEVWTRDEGKCTYVGPTGRRCKATYQVQVHHLDPHGKGGPPTVENLTLRCRAHNLYAAEQDYGAEHIAEAISRSRSRVREQYSPAYVRGRLVRWDYAKRSSVAAQAGSRRRLPSLVTGSWPTSRGRTAEPMPDRRRTTS
jgi:5-methylcytosine-specific restriction endonuclease McrA